MPRPQHLGPRRHALAQLVAGGVLVSLVTAGGVYAYDRYDSEVSVARDSADAANDVRRATDPGRTSAADVVAAADPAVERLVAIRAEERREARAAKRAAERAEQLRREREQARREREKAREEAEKLLSSPIDVKIGSFNVLGSQHTDADGPRRNFPPASVRTARTAGLVAKHGVDILGTQELQDDQLRDLQNRTGMAAYPGFGWGSKETDNSILWDPSVFEMVSGSRFTITFVDRPRPQPILRLRHLATGRELYVVNTHPSPGEGRYLTQRRNAQATLVAIVNDLKATGLPVLVTGDMNDRGEFFCNVVPQAGMSASNGGSYGSGCQPPPEPMPVDWVVGTDATWSNYWRDTEPTDNNTSDHFFISALARLL